MLNSSGFVQKFAQIDQVYQEARKIVERMKYTPGGFMLMLEVVP